MKVRVAVFENGYHYFFKLQDICQNLGAYLMDYLVLVMRGIGLRHMIKAYIPSISVKFVLKILGFEIGNRMISGKKWFVNCDCKFDDDKCVILTKSTILHGQLFIGNSVSSLI